MERLEQLRRANPHIAIHSVHEPLFARYGRVIEEDTAPWRAAAESAVDFPETGSQYQAVLPELDELPQAEMVRQRYCGHLDEQFGLCWGHANRLNALEWHTCSEFNIAVRELVLLLAKRSDITEGRLDANKVAAFYLEQGAMVEVYADSLHFCPCQVTSSGFSCVVGLQRGTNLPLDPEKAVSPMLWAKNKWLIAHRDNAPLVARGAYPGIFGENWQIFPID